MKSFLFVFVALSIVYDTIGQDEPPPGFFEESEIQQAPPGAPLPINPSGKACGYNSLSNLLQDEGGKIGNQNGYNIGLEQCKQKCTDTYACKSFTWCSIGFTKCHMKDKIVNLDRYEPTKNDPNCKTYYPKECQKFGCNCGESCRMSNGRRGVCQENGVCAQNINAPFCGKERTCKYFGESCGFGANGFDNGECCGGEGGLICMQPWRQAPGAPNTCRRCYDDPSWTDYKYGDKNNIGRCIDLTLDFCNNNAKYGDNYTEEARKNCPKSCGLC